MSHSLQVKGKASWFGGPDDEGVSEDEGLAFIYDVDDAPHLFLSYQPEGTTGLARRLNPDALYVAMRWPYDSSNKEEWRELLLREMALVSSPKTGKVLKVYPADWGPHGDTGRVADLSPAALTTLGIETDDEVEVVFPFTRRDETPKPQPYDRIVISSGHGKYVRGASGILDEVDEARRVVERVAEGLRAKGVDVTTFHDNVSTDQSTNLHTIVDFHNDQDRQLDVSVHFNAYVETTGPMGTECLYVTQVDLADQVAEAIASCGFIDRGPKKRTDLYFLNQTMMPSILIEVCFVDSSADAKVYNEQWAPICDAIVAVLCGEEAKAWV